MALDFEWNSLLNYLYTYEIYYQLFNYVSKYEYYVFVFNSLFNICQTTRSVAVIEGSPRSQWLGGTGALRGAVYREFKTWSVISSSSTAVTPTSLPAFPDECPALPADESPALPDDESPALLDERPTALHPPADFGSQQTTCWRPSDVMGQWAHMRMWWM